MLEVQDMQGLLVRGYTDLVAARYLMLRLGPTGGREWLASVVPDVTPGRPAPPDVAVNIAFTAAGFAAIGLPPLTTDFAAEFLDGMTEPQRSRTLGDTDESDPAKWQWGGPANPPVHVALMLFAKDWPTLDTLTAVHDDKLSAHGVTAVARLETSNLHGYEQFGFRDGISQPVIEGLSRRTADAANTVKAGEFILGYPNGYGLYTDRPTIRPSDDPAKRLSPDGDFGRNGTYLVFRTLKQDAGAFKQFLEDQTKSPDGQVDPAACEWLGAKIVGRWKSGAPVVRAPQRDDPALSGFNDFRYANEDPGGLKCPIGAHVRRSNPRDSLDPDPGSDKSLEVNNHHRLLRRGREYGPAFADDPVAERGLHFICLAGNISRQFEFIQRSWLNNPKFNQMYDDADPLVGPHTPTGGTFVLQAEPVRRRISPLPRFVTVAGGAYFFLPGLRALQYLSGRV